MRTRLDLATTVGLLLTVVLVAVPARADFECPDRGGPAWREVRTAHFLVQTDLGSGDAQALAAEVERLFDVVRYGLFKAPPDSPGTIRVVALRNEEEFDLFAAAKVGAYYRRETDAGPTIVLPGKLQEAQRVVIAHELTHHVMARVYARQPWWFSEGMASVMETVGSSGPSNTPTVGGVPQHRYRELMPYRGGMAGLLTRVPDGADEKTYAMAWALAHFLLNQRPAEFGQLQARFWRGQRPAEAWREIFPQWDPASADGSSALDDEVARYLRKGVFRYRDVRLPAEAPVTERPLSAADAHGVRLSLLPWLNRGKRVKPEVIKAELDEALAHDSGHVLALTRLARETPRDGLVLAERAIAAHPEDARAWMLLAEHLDPADQARQLEACRRAATLDPDNATALNNSAWLLLGQGQVDEALRFSSQAVKLVPWSPPLLDTLAAVLERKGQCASALDVQHRAVDRLSDGWPKEARAAYQERLARLEAQCGAGQPVPGEATRTGQSP